MAPRARSFSKRRASLSTHSADVSVALRQDLELLLARVCAVQDLEIAEHLLRALEVLARRSPGSLALDATYHMLANQFSGDDAENRFDRSATKR